MAGFTGGADADALLADGLARAQGAFTALQADPLPLDRKRQLFSDSPLPYTSSRSGTTTQFTIPDPPSKEQQRRKQRRIQLAREADASLPNHQFSHQINEAESSPPPFSFFPKKPRPKSDDGRRVVREREREASSPYHQFVYQISKERERIQEESANGEGADANDINTTAYENVKNTWTKSGIWNRGWGILPGMSWKHEEPLEEEVVPARAPFQADPLGNGNHEPNKATAIIFNGGPLTDIFGRPVTSLSQGGIFLRNPSLVESNHRQAPVSSVAEDPVQTASTVPSKLAVRPKPGAL